MTRPAPIPVISLLVLLLPMSAAGQDAALPVPPPPVPEARSLTAAEAALIAGRVLKIRVGEPGLGPRGFVFPAEGFSDGRRCPLEGIRDVRCGDFAWRPSRVVLLRRAVVGAVTGHLARNLVVLIELTSEDAGVASGTLHGALVFPGPVPAAGDHPAFAWYVGREARALSTLLQDVNGDGSLDLLYTYDQRLPGGRRVAARDVWAFPALKAEKLISSGEKLSGVGTSIFDGVPLDEDGPDGAVRGVFRFEALARGMPLAGVFERARLAGVRSGWDLRVVADFGDGWREILAGAGPASEGGDVAAQASCQPLDVPAEADMEVRRRLLDLETACRRALAAANDVGPAPWKVPERLLAALGLNAVGLPMAALGLRERAANDLALLSPRAWLVAVILSLSAALPADRALADTLGPGAVAERWDALGAFPVLSPILLPIDGVLRLVRQVASWLDPSAGPSRLIVRGGV
jgi:hypothetical protein